MVGSIDHGRFAWGAQLGLCCALLAGCAAILQIDEFDDATTTSAGAAGTAAGGHGAAGGAGGSGGAGGAGAECSEPLGGSAPVSPLGPSWATTFGGLQADLVQALTVDGDGNVIVGGEFRGTANFGGGDQVSVGGKDVFVVKFDPSGNYLWDVVFGGPGLQQVYAMAVDSGGRISVSGIFETSITIGSNLLSTTEGTEGFVAQLSPAGAVNWAKRLDGTNGSTIVVPDGLAMANGDAIVVVGAFDGTLFIDGSEVTSHGGFDVFAAVLSPDGTLQWLRSYGGTQNDKGRDVAVTPAGRIVVAAHYAGTASYGDEQLQSSGDSTDWLVLQLSSSGDVRWARGFGGPDPEWPHALAVDVNGNAAVVGYFSGRLPLGPDLLCATGEQDALVVKLDEDGDVVGWRILGGDGLQEANRVAVDSDGQIAVGGWFRGDLAIGEPELSSVDGDDGFVIELDAALMPLGRLAVGEAGNDRLRGVGYFNGDELYVAGEFAELLFDQHACQGVTDGFVAKLSY